MPKISAEDWREVFELLDTALELPVAARATWLSTLDGQPVQVTDTLRELLARQTADNFLNELPQFTGSPDLPAMDSVAETLDVGSIVGPYRLLARLGRGGMSTVWTGERIDGMLKRRVAIKLPHVAWAAPDVAQRMARERDLLGSLEHPNIARLYDAGVSADGRPFLALELVDGVAVDAYCAAHCVDVATRVSLALQTARTVAYAHSRSIVHRDLKPSNILVDSTGQVRLLDFGIGKLLEVDAMPTPADTQFGSRLFTPDYASPEQLRGEPVTASSDVFSLGVVLYQLLCRQLPFASRTSGAPAVAARAPSTRCVGADAQALRGDLDTIVLKALKDSPQERYLSMSALADDLERYQRGEPVLARPDSAWYRTCKFAARNRRLLGGIGIAVAATLAVGVGFAVYQSREFSASTARALEQSADAMAERALPDTAPRDVKAYREYLQARSLMLRPTEENLHEIVRLVESSIARDPAFAHAHALLAGANVLFLDIGFARPDALARAEPAAHRALELDANLPGAYATLGSIAAHRGLWLVAEEHFKRAFELDDQSGRIRARYAQVLLLSAGHLDAARREFQSQFRLTPAHARGAMQVATALGMLAGRESEALKHVDIALSLGWPADSRDVSGLLWQTSRRAGQYEQAAEYQMLDLAPSLREARAGEIVPLLHAALRVPSSRESALLALDALAVRLRLARTDSFASTMFFIHWYAMLGDLDRAYASSSRWVDLASQSGLSGIPFNAGFWLPEMRAFRADPRFSALASRLGLVAYWRAHGAPDHCELRAEILCRP